MKILIATKNQGKLNEIQDFLKSLDSMEFHNLFDVKLDFDVEETGRTYKDNALIKAKSYHTNSYNFTLADDSGIEIPIISNLLGVKTRRFGAGENASDQEWLDYFLDFSTFPVLFKVFRGIIKDLREDGVLMVSEEARVSTSVI